MPAKRKSSQKPVISADGNKKSKGNEKDPEQTDSKNIQPNLPLAEMSVIERWIKDEVERRVKEHTQDVQGTAKLDESKHLGSAKVVPLEKQVACIKIERDGEGSVYLHHTEEDAVADLISHQMENINAELYEGHHTSTTLKELFTLEWVVSYFESITQKEYVESTGEVYDCKDPDKERVTRLKTATDIPNDVLSHIEQSVCGVTSSVQKNIYPIE